MSPLTERSMDCQENESSPSFFMTFTADDRLPSGRVPTCWIVQRLPLCVHFPSPKPPSESNTQERICLAIGSQPITCMPAMFTRSRTTIANERVIKFLFFAHSQSV